MYLYFKNSDKKKNTFNIQCVPVWWYFKIWPPDRTNIEYDTSHAYDYNTGSRTRSPDTPVVEDGAMLADSADGRAWYKYANTVADGIDYAPIGCSSFVHHADNIIIIDCEPCRQNLVIGNYNLLVYQGLWRYNVFYV